MAATMEIDWKALGEEIGAVALEGMRDLIEGAQEDIKMFGADIGKSMVSAIRAGNKPMQTELKQQLVVLLEINRVRAVKEALDVIERVIQTAAQVALRVLTVAGMALV